MVECELKTNQRNKSSKSVLIDTWWNVNETAVKIATPGNAVLIDTWWNVNQRMPEASPQQLRGFNRYMVECELQCYRTVLNKCN